MILFNEGYNKYSDFYTKGKGSIVYSSKKSYIDLSCGAGTLLLGHNSKIRISSIKDYLKKGLSQFSHPNKSAVDLSKSLISASLSNNSRSIHLLEKIIDFTELSPFS